jgi:hypothetical protein
MNNTELINILDASTYENDELFNIIKSNFNNTDNIMLKGQKVRPSTD